MSANPVKAYSYIRFSSKPQEFGDSIRRQTEGTVALCQRRGWTLDRTLSLTDKGISAWKGINRVKGALGRFISLAEDGKIPEGSFLVLENLDRLSREELRPAISLLLRILDCRINIATVKPETVFLHDNTDQTSFILAVLELARGNRESVLKSERCTAAWQGRANNIANEIYTANCPGWLQANKKRTGFVLVPERAAVVYRVFKLAADGKGSGMIARLMNAEDVIVPTARGKRWHASTVQKLLAARTVLGEFQRYEGRGGKRVPVGDPLKDYYPAVPGVAELWEKVQRVQHKTSKYRGPVGPTVTNLFSSLLYCPRDNASMYCQMKDRKSGHFVVSSHAVRGIDRSKFYGFPYAVLEEAVLKCMTELKPADLSDAGTNDETAELTGKLISLTRKIDGLKQQMRDGDANDFGPLVEMLREFGEQKEKIKKQLNEVRLKVTDTTLDDVHSVIGMLNTAKDKEAIRLKLRSVIADLVERIWVLVVPLSKFRTAPKAVHIQIDFRAGISRHILTRNHSPYYVSFKADMTPLLLPRDTEKVEAAVVKYWEPRLRPTRNGGKKFKV